MDKKLKDEVSRTISFLQEDDWDDDFEVVKTINILVNRLEDALSALRLMYDIRHGTRNAQWLKAIEQTEKVLKLNAKEKSDD